MSDAIRAIRQMLENNMGRPLSPEVLIDQLHGGFSACSVRLAFWEGRATGELEFTDDFMIQLPDRAGGSTLEERETSDE